MPQQKISHKADAMLSELSLKRKLNDDLVKTKQDITAQAIELLYKKEIGANK